MIWKIKLSLLLVVFCNLALAQPGVANLDHGKALAGYDAVAYLTEKKAVKGQKQFAATYQGGTYYFATAQHKDSFLTKPAAYVPQYGGWCAYAMGDSGDKVSVDPETFKVIDGKLYLFYNAYFNNTLKTWNKGEVQLKKKADANWKQIVK